MRIGYNSGPPWTWGWVGSGLQLQGGEGETTQLSVVRATRFSETLFINSKESYKGRGLISQG